MDSKSLLGNLRLCLTLGLGALIFDSSFAADAPSAPPPPQVQRPAQASVKERCEALKARLFKEAYDWHIYAQIGDLLMEMSRPREAASAYEKAIAIYPLSKERSAEMRQAEFIAAQASAEETRQKIARDAAERQAQEAAMAATMQTLSMLPGASSAGAIHAQQAASAAAAMTQGLAQADAASAAAKAAGIANPTQQVSFTLPERQETANLWIKLGRAYEAYGEHDRSGPAFEQGLSMDPARFDALYLTGVSLLSSGQRAKAVLAASRYLSLAPSDPPVTLCILMGDALRGLGLEGDAISAYTAASRTLSNSIAAKPSDLASPLALGSVQIKTGNYAAALEAFKRARVVSPSSTTALSGLIICQISLGDKAGLKESADLLRPRASTIDEWYVLARANDALGDDTASAACYGKCVSLWDAANPGQETQPGLVAFARAGAGKPDIAIGLLKERISKEPFATDSFLDLHRLGLAYLKGKTPRPDLAADAFRQCLEENPSFTQAAIELKALAPKLEGAVSTLLAESSAATDKQESLLLRARAWALMPDGPQRERTLMEISAIAKSLGQPQIPDEASMAWLKANSLLSSKRNLADVKRASFEFRRAYLLAPWNQALMANLAACHSVLDRNDLATAEMELSMRLPDGRTQESLARKFEYETLQARSAKEAHELNPFK